MFINTIHKQLSDFTHQSRKYKVDCASYHRFFSVIIFLDLTKAFGPMLIWVLLCFLSLLFVRKNAVSLLEFPKKLGRVVFG